MGACCTTLKQQPIKNQQLKRPVSSSPTKSNQKVETPHKQLSATKGKPRDSFKSPEQTPDEFPPAISVERPQGIDKHDAQSPFSIAQEDSAELDEKIVNLDVTINQSKEENRVRLNEVQRFLDTSLAQKDLIVPKLDLTLPNTPHQPIYQITNEFPVVKPYSSPAEWQRVLSKHVFKQSQIINDKIPELEDDLLMENLLNLGNRNWIKEQIALHIENMNAMQDSLDSLVRQKKSIQLREHFTWLVWAVAQYYFRTNHNVNNEPVVLTMTKQDSSTTQFTRENQSETQSEFFGKSLQSNASVISQITGQNQAISGGVSSKSNKPSFTTTGLPIKLPKTNNETWAAGFTYKGVYFKLIPYEDSLYIREELKALKYAQIELLDLQMIDNSNQDSRKPLSRSQSQLHREMILPLLTGVQCAGFFLYGTPLIYTQEVQDRKQSVDLSNVKAKENVSFSLPRMGSCVPEINLAQLKGKFDYLHDNIEDENLNDPLLQMMPLLKHITKKNLIPIIDFEEFNNAQQSKSIFGPHSKPKQANAQSITVNYLTVYLTRTLRTLSCESTSSALFKIPSLNTEELQFIPFPSDRQLSYTILDQMLKNSPLIGPGASLKPRGDVSYSPRNSFQLSRTQMSHMGQPDIEDDSPVNLQLSKRMLQKHGWRFIMVEKANNSSKQAENKRAFAFYSQRENFGNIAPSCVQGAPVQHVFDTRVKPAEDQTFNFSMVHHPDDFEDKTPRKEDVNMIQRIKVQISNQKDEIKTGRENLESSPEIHRPQLAQENNPPLFISPKKRTILRKPDPTTQEEPLMGNCVVSGFFIAGFKLQFSLSQHTYSSGIESMFQLQLDSAAKVLDSADRIHNVQAYKELLHRKGLNLRFSWVLLAKVKLQSSRDVIMAAILCRTMRRIVNEEAKIKSKCGKKAFTKISTTQNSATGTVSVERTEHYRGILDIYKEIICLYVNAVVKNKFAKYKQVFEETLLGLFLSRLRIISMLSTLDLSQAEANYLESKDILDHVVELPSRNPILFLNSVQSYFNMTFKSEFLRHYRQDKYIVLNRTQPLHFNEIRKLNMSVVTYFTMREQAYLILARKISFNKAKQSQKIVIENQKIAKAFNKPKFNNEASFTERNLETVRAEKNVSKSANQRGIAQMIGKDTQRAFYNIESSGSAVSGFGSGVNLNHSFQNIIDLSRVVKKSGFTPKTPSEIFLPSVLYKMQTQVQVTSKNTVLQPFYEMPNIDVMNEWVIVLESLFKDVQSAYGSEQVLIEALVYQCLITFFVDADQDGAFKILTKIRDLLQEALHCSPELIVMCMMLSGLIQDANDEIEMFPIESEKNYLAAMVLSFQIYGDPRGRGNYGIPYQLFFSWKLSLLALAESRKLSDSELAEEMFDATLQSLFNHKKMYRKHQIDIQAAQEHASQLRDMHNEFSYTQDMSKRQTIFSLNFELAVEQQDYRNQHFNVKRYSKRAKRIVTTAGFTKPTVMNANVSFTGRKVLETIKETEGNRIQDTLQSARSTNQNIAGKINLKAGNSAHPSMQSSAILKESLDRKKKERYEPTQKTNPDDIGVSDVEIQMLDSFSKNHCAAEGRGSGEDDTQSQLKAANFCQTEHLVGNIPFPHWTISRQMISSQQQSLAQEKPAEAKRIQKEFIKDQITKNFDIDALFAWLVNNNPMMVPTGIQWDSRTIKEIVFCPSQNIVNSSDSSIAFSNNKLSQYSYRSDALPQRKRKQHLGPYSQCLSKDVGGIQKGEIMGLLYTWGTDQYGQLGLDNFVAGKQMGSIQSLKVLHPRLLVPLKDELIKDICCGYSHTLAVNQYGQLYVWGHNESGQLGLGYDNIPAIIRRPILNSYVQNVSKVVASHEHSMALTRMSELYTWGSSMLTGLDDKENRHIPTPMDFFKNKKIVQVSCGGLHTMVLTKKGALYAWGSTEGGQLGIPELTQETVMTPQKVERISGQKVVQVACGEAHTVALTDQAKVWGWGMSMYGQLGLGFSSDSFEPGVGMQLSRVNEPTEITPFMPPHVKVTNINCGAMFTLFITDENELYGCGINDLGQLGLDTYLEEMQVTAMQRAIQTHGVRKIVTSDVTVPSRVICFENMKVSAIACGENHSLALVGEDKSLWAWGMFKNGQLGLGEVSLKMNPRPIQPLCNTNIHRLAAGSQHSVALLGDSTQLQNLSHSFYLNSDLLSNPWNIDIRKVCVAKPIDSIDEEES